MDKSKPYQLGLYEKALPSTLSWEEKLNAAKVSGFDYLEISIDETPDKLSRLDNKTIVEEIQAAVKKTGIPINSLCLSRSEERRVGKECR